MYSQCPECHARFRVAAGDLRAGRGIVRCGRCRSAFNALESLSDTVPPALGMAERTPARDDTAAPATSHESVAGVEFHFTADDIESVFIEPGGWPRHTRPRERGTEADETQVAGGEPPNVEVTEDQPFEDITLEGERISIESILGIETSDDEPTDEFQVLHEIPDSAYPEDDHSPAGATTDVAPFGMHATVAPTDSVVPPVAGIEAGPAPWRAPRNAPAPGPIAAVAAGDALADETSLSEALAAEPTRVRWSGATAAWSAGCLLVALALLAQVTHQFRQDLVRHPQIGPLLKDVYARLGIPLTPNWDLGAFELRQWGNGGGPDANGRLTVRASLSNRASFAQPHPILRLELDDRFGDAVAVRDFEPAEYLKSPAEAPRLLGPGASADAELLIADPGQDAVGYQLDVCLRESAAVLRCARGPG